MDEIKRLTKLVSARRLANQEKSSELQAEFERRRHQAIGPLYGLMLQSQEMTFRNLSNSDSKIRQAALHLYSSQWKPTDTKQFSRTCRELAENDPDDDVRSFAIKLYGKSLAATRNSEALQFLATMVLLNSKNSEKVHHASYWALREVDVGCTSEEGINRSIAFFKRLLSDAKIHANSSELDRINADEQLLKDSFISEGDVEKLWNTADEIDIDYVKQFLGPS